MRHLPWQRSAWERLARWLSTDGTRFSETSEPGPNARPSLDVGVRGFFLLQSARFEAGASVAGRMNQRQ